MAFPKAWNRTKRPEPFCGRPNPFASEGAKPARLEHSALPVERRAQSRRRGPARGMREGTSGHVLGSSKLSCQLQLFLLIFPEKSAGCRSWAPKLGASRRVERLEPGTPCSPPLPPLHPQFSRDLLHQIEVARDAEGKWIWVSSALPGPVKPPFSVWHGVLVG